MRNLLFISIITFFLQSCAPIVGTIGIVSLGAASKEKGLGTSINDNLIKTKISNLVYKILDDYNGSFRMIGHSAGGHLASRMICKNFLKKNIGKHIENVISV